MATSTIRSLSEPSRRRPSPPLSSSPRESDRYTTVDADHQDAPPQRISTDEELAAAVDPLFRDYDSDADGFIDYTEFKNYQSQQRT
ncbi:hypothetical protein LSTR_LSTR014261 [Laodelphax striatellus]|uniref:EF-hand domain-containing protein n=1 Tax=Laodelphax striatellus TaxID=195883 RepID=A0A482WPW0_LAOST|nr:hypothetical protein LSTR_LSTR014261 [Laodelphax striatellus]